MPDKDATTFPPRFHAAVLKTARALLMLFVFTVAGNVPAQSPAQETNPRQTAHYTADGAESCLFCHSSRRMQVVAETPHGNRSNPHAPFGQHDCESCHGPGSLHATRSRRGKGRPPMTTFGPGKTTPLAQQTSVCLGCHEKNMGDLPAMQWHGSPHDNTDTSCANCHSMHVEANPLADRHLQIETCMACHAEPAGALGAVTWTGSPHDKGDTMCSSCHKLHAAKTILDDKHGQTEVCLSCHADTAGALEGMQWRGSAHDTDDIACSSCHQTHSIDNPLADRRQQADICFECHEKQKTAHPRFEDKGIAFDKLSCWSCHDVHQLIPDKTTAAATNGFSRHPSASTP